jgi:hypothetical protein
MLAVVVLALLVPAAKAQAGWSRGPDMVQPRINAAAALLHDGSVLMVGGRLYDLGFAGVERLDPAGGASTPAAGLLQPRMSATAVTLPDGSVLAIGGWWFGSPAGSERYDPASRTWSSSGPGVGAWDVPAVQLGDGRVFAVGGSGWDQPTGEAGIFDPATDAWSRAADYPENVEMHSATLLADGRVLVLGGRSWLADYFFWYSPMARVYDPGTNAWSDVAAMPQPRAGHLATGLRDGRVLVVGGGNDDYGPIPSTLLYDPVADRWTTAAPLPPEFRPQASVRLRDGTVLVIGDYVPDTGVTASMRYDPATNAWSDPEPLVEHRGWGFTTTLLADGRVLVAGGFTPRIDGFSGTTEIWAPPCPPRPSRGCWWSDSGELHCGRAEQASSYRRDRRCGAGAVR